MNPVDRTHSLANAHGVDIDRRKAGNGRGFEQALCRSDDDAEAARNGTQDSGEATRKIAARPTPSGLQAQGSDSRNMGGEQGRYVDVFA
jgi:hypothetical protein